MKTESQCKTLLSLMKQGAKITSLDAMKIGCLRLASRVYDLRDAGHNVKDEWIESNGKRFKRYFMAE